MILNIIWKTNETAKGKFLDEALASINRAIQMDTSEISVHYKNNLALVNMEMGNLEKSFELLSIDTNRVTINNTGIYLEKIGDEDKAYKNYSQALSIDPKYKEALKNKIRLESSSTRKNKEWVTYWIFLTNDLFEIDGHTFLHEKYSLKQIDFKLVDVNYYRFKYRKKNNDKNEIIELKQNKLHKKYNPKQCPIF